MYKALLLLLCTCFLRSTAQPNEHYSIPSLAVSKTVYNIYKDRKGYLWFAMDNGVAKFNGKDLKRYSLFDGLTDNTVVNFYEDRMGRLWLFTYNGAPCYIKNDSVFNAYNDPLLRRIPVMSYIRTMCEADDSTLYIGYNIGAVIKVRHTSVTTVLKSSDYDRISVLYANKPYLNVISGKFKICLKNDKVLFKDTQSTGHLLGYIYGNKLLLADDTSISLTDGRRILWRYTDTKLTGKTIIKLYLDSRGNIFCCTQDGLTVFNTKTNEKKILLRDIAVSSICEDVDGNYWVATLNEGLYYFKRDYADIHPLGALLASTVIQAHNGEIFLVNRGHVYNWLMEPMNITLAPGWKPLCSTGDYFIYSNTDVSIAYNRRTKKQAGFNGGRFKICYPIGNNRFFLLSDNRTFDISIAKYGRININDSFFTDEKIIHSYHDTAAKCFYFATPTHLYMYAPANKNFKTIDSFSSLQAPIGLFMLSNKIIIPGNGHRFIVYNTKPGIQRLGTFKFHSPVFLSAKPIDKNSYLCNANDGYYILRADTTETFNYSFTKIEYPFNSSQVNAMYLLGDSILCNIDDELYLFNKNMLNKVIKRPVCFIDDVRVNGKPYDATSAVIRNEVSCNVRISLSSLYFGTPDIKYMYRINGPAGTREWFTSNTGELNLLLPEFGFYTIEIKAISGSMLQSATQLVYIKWLAPFYLRWWFKAIVVFILLTYIVYIIFIYVSRKKQAFRNELKYIRMENKAINSLINPHFIFNAINNIQNLINLQASEDANEYLAMLSRLIRQNIENLQFDVIALQQELSLINNYMQLQNLRYNNRIHYTVNAPPNANTVNIPPLLIHTFVENSIVHGFSTQFDDFSIAIDIETESPDYLLIRITDNGHGLARAKAENPLKDKTSLGIDIARKRIERLSAYYRVEYNLDITDRANLNERGTMVTIRIYSKFENPVLSDTH